MLRDVSSSRTWWHCSHTSAEQTDHHVARVVSAAHVVQRADHVAGFEPSHGKNSAIARAALAELAQVIREDVVAGNFTALVARIFPTLFFNSVGECLVLPAIVTDVT